MISSFSPKTINHTLQLFIIFSTLHISTNLEKTNYTMPKADRTFLVTIVLGLIAIYSFLVLIS